MRVERPSARPGSFDKDEPHENWSYHFAGLVGIIRGFHEHRRPAAEGTGPILEDAVRGVFRVSRSVFTDPAMLSTSAACCSRIAGSMHETFGITPMW